MGKIKIYRRGKKIYVEGKHEGFRHGEKEWWIEDDSTIANLLYEVIMELRKKRKTKNETKI